MSYNQCDLLSDAVNSILNQTYQPTEILICDDASSDNSQELILKLAEKYPNFIIPVLHKRNGGIPKNLNSGISIARGDWITWLAADDIFYEDKLKLEVEALERLPSAKIVYSNYYQVDKIRNKTSAWANSNSKLPEGNLFLKVITQNVYKNRLYRNELVEKKLIDEVGRFDEALKIWEDWDIQIRTSAKAAVACNPIPQLEYRVHPGGMHNTDNSIQRNTKSIISKNSNLLNMLSDAEAKYAIKITNRRFKRSEISYDYKNASFTRKIRYLSSFVKMVFESPTDISVYKFIVQLLLPRKLVNLLIRLK